MIAARHPRSWQARPDVSLVYSTFNPVRSRTTHGRSWTGKVAAALATPLIMAALVTLMPASPALAAAAVAPEVLGTNWLSGHGVNVCYPIGAACTGTTAYPAEGTNNWQCEELAARLWSTRNWYSGGWTQDAYQLYGGLASSQVTDHPNDGSYVPVPGDLIIHAANDGFAEGAGHVAVVDSVDPGTLTIHAVEENVSPAYETSPGRATYVVSGGHWIRQGTSARPIGFVHANANPYTNSPGNSSPAVAFQANTGSLWTVGSDNRGTWNLGMMAGTSPSITELSNGGYEVAFQANTGQLWVVGSAGSSDTGLGMMAGTSPSITGMSNGGYEVAFQANTGSLWTVGSDNRGAWNLGMMAGTSPSITELSNGGYEVAFQANTGQLWVVGSAGSSDTGLGMRAGTSPSITGMSNGGYEVAFQANTGSLWTVGSDNRGTWNLGMRAGTSPSITELSNGGYEVAFQANTGSLWTVGSDNRGTWNLGMRAGTSPSITGMSNGAYEVAFQANTGSLWTVGSDNRGAWNLGMMAGTSPSITG